MIRRPPRSTLVRSAPASDVYKRQVTAGVRTLGRHRDLDVVVVIRGGGSRSELATFDHEAIATAIALSPLPVFTGLGDRVLEPRAVVLRLQVLNGPDGHFVMLGGAGRVLADGEHPLGLVTYQSFDEADYERFYAGLTPAAEDEWWARWDNTKPGIDAARGRSATLWLT